MKRYPHLGRDQLVERVHKLEQNVAAAEVRQARRLRQRRREQAALRDSEARLRAILDTAVEGIITINDGGIIESVNPAAERIFGYRSAELIGRNVSLLMPSPFRENHDRYIGNYVRTRQPKIIGIGREVIGQRKNRSVFPMDLAVSEVKLADRRIFTGFVRDITERKRLEQEILEISESEQRRIGQDLHDGLGQQLTAIELMCRVLQQRLATTVKAEATRVGEISGHVREAIALTRSLARGLSPVDLEAPGLMTALEELAANAGKMFGINCRFRCDPPVLVPDKSVAAHLFRIAQEGVTNSIKHGRAREVDISLTALPQGVILAVKDNGVGFWNNRRKPKGMGLRIMNYRANLIGGSLVVQRNASRGTTVVCSVHHPAVEAGVSIR